MTYWFEKARAQIEAGQARAAGLVATNSIRGGANRTALERIRASGRIFEAWSDEPWVNEGAAVRVSLVCFGPKEAPHPTRLNGEPVTDIHADLTASTDVDAADITTARLLKTNAGVSFQGSSKKGSFDVTGDQARKWLTEPNPNTKSNCDVVRPWQNGRDIVQSHRDMCIIDFGTDIPEDIASLYESPFEYLLQNVKPEREKNNRQSYRKYWWRHAEPRIAMRAALEKLQRYIATVRVSKHRLFVWVNRCVLPDDSLIIISRADDTTFGVLHSRFHELWSLRLCTWLGKGNDPRYTPTTTFETFPFPAGLTPADTAGPTEILDGGVILPTVAAGSRDYALAIAEAAHRLNARRDTWLNPPEWTERVPEIVPGYPDRILPRPGHEADLKRRTLTNLYNARPAWLDQAHRALDAAVAAAYGWTDYSPELPDSEILRRLLALNLERAG